MTEQEQKEWDAKMRNIDAVNAKVQAEIVKSITENKWYIAVVSSTVISAVILATVTLTKLFLS